MPATASVDEREFGGAILNSHPHHPGAFARNAAICPSMARAKAGRASHLTR